VIIHVARNTADGQPSPTIIGNNCTVGHSATVHACTIGDNCMVGMGATVLDHAKVSCGLY
jgi:carbonic anhydrase/acetyltransferase-like protein (isoleucine patch superfamily)